MKSIPTRTFLLLLFFSSLVAAVNFAQCLEDFKNDPDAVGGVDSKGHPTTPAEAVGLTYNACTVLCGSDPEGFLWKDFAQLFALWLLPWLALISQLPFGSENYADDFISVVICVGSPALAAYTLVLTALNARSVYRRTNRIQHGSKTAAARALISLQQTPLELTKDDRLLAFIPISDQWRREIVDRLDRRNTWSVVTGSSVAWVVIAFLFTLVDSFLSLDSPDGVSEGHAVGTLWLWLLCLVIGWLWVPTFTCRKPKSALRDANRKTTKGAAKRIKQKASKAYNSARAGIANRIPKRMLILGSKKLGVGGVLEVPGDNEKVREESIKENNKGADKAPIQKANLLADPTHHQSAVSFQVPPESQHGHDYFNVSSNPTANQSSASFIYSAAGQSITSIRPEGDGLLIPKDEFSSLNRDELRLAATFNYSRTMRYLALVDDVLKALNEHTRSKGGMYRSVLEVTSTPSTEDLVFPQGALVSMFSASVFALILQCGTTAAAAIIVVFTPTVGLGCRSLGYIIYGGIAIIILFLTIISTVFARISETRGERSLTVKGFTAFIAIALRRISLLLALINTTGLLVVSCFQFSHFFDSCYCNASVLGRGADSHIIIYYEGWVSTMRTARIAATTLAAAAMAVYMIFLWLMSALPAEIDYL